MNMKYAMAEMSGECTRPEKIDQTHNFFIIVAYSEAEPTLSVQRMMCDIISIKWMALPIETMNLFTEQMKTNDIRPNFHASYVAVNKNSCTPHSAREEKGKKLKSGTGNSEST